ARQATSGAGRVCHSGGRRRLPFGWPAAAATPPPSPASRRKPEVVSKVPPGVWLPATLRSRKETRTDVSVKNGSLSRTHRAGEGGSHAQRLRRRAAGMLDRSDTGPPRQYGGGGTGGCGQDRGPPAGWRVPVGDRPDAAPDAGRGSDRAAYGRADRAGRGEPAAPGARGAAGGAVDARSVPARSGRLGPIGVSWRARAAVDAETGTGPAAQPG